MNPAATFRELIRHEDFVRKTLRGLLRDDAQVDDAMQQTWLKVLRRPHTLPLQPATWLLQIARRCAISGWRSERRRERREELVARRAEAESAAASLGRMETRQRVVTAILALEEPYRSVVLLRYEQDLDVATIANRRGRSPATVRSQLSRAHALLRERLDHAFGGRERWGVLAAPLLRTGGRAVGLGLATAAGLAAAAVAFAIAWSAFAEPIVPPVRDVVAAHAPAGATLQPVVAASVVPAPAAASLRVAAMAQEPRPAGLQERLLPAGQLRDRGFYDDYEAATFSFQHGLRDDPDLKITHNDWDVLFDHGKFLVDTVTDDDSAILDLGPLDPRAFGRWQVGEPTFAKTAAVTAGHAYFIGTCDGDTQLATIVFVRSHEPGDVCTFDWYATDGTNRAQGSLGDPGQGQAWVAQLEALRQRQMAPAGQVLAKPEVRLQLRGGAGGGNTRSLDMKGGARRVDTQSREPLDLATPIAMTERCVGHVAGGRVPAGQVFVITHIEYTGGNPGDSNGRGAFRVVVGRETVVDVAASELPVRGSWSGKLPVEAGHEQGVRFEIGNSSWGEVWLRGEFQAVPAGRGFGGANAGFFTTPPAAAGPRPWLLGVPLANLQVRAGSVGGNPCRIDLRGRKNLYVRTLSRTPLDFASPLTDPQDSLAFARGGLLPDGMTFVVTKVVYSGAAKGNGNGKGAFRLVVAGTRLVDQETSAEPIAGEWTGSLTIVPGEESRTYLEIANGSHGDVTLSGHFEPKK